MSKVLERGKELGCKYSDKLFSICFMCKQHEQEKRYKSFREVALAISQLKQQKELHEREIEDQNKLNKLVVIKPTIMLSTFVGLLDKIIIQNNYNRELLLSGEDGFDIFDNDDKRKKQLCRVLHIDNMSNYDITDIVLKTESCLENRNTNELKKYNTKNVIKL